MQYQIECPLCGSNCQKQDCEGCTIFECTECGRFQIDYFSSDEVHLTDEHKLILSHYYRSLAPTDERRLKVITSKNIDDIIGNVYYPKSLVEKVDNVLSYFCKKTKYFGQVIGVSDKTRLITELFCTSLAELDNIFKYLVSENYLTFPVQSISSPEQYIVTMEGLRRYEELEKMLLNNRLNSNIAFVAMWFNGKEKEDKERFRPDMQNIYANYIQPAIENGNRFKAIKIDKVEHNNDINDEMIAQIRKSKFMIADLTGYRGGVYWEAGFAYGLGLPVIYTCHEKWLEGVPEKGIERVHFDINHRNIIKWNEDDLEGFKKKLANRISAVIP